MYVNVFYLILNDEKYQEERELCVNLAAFAQSFGFFFSSLTSF